MNARPQEYVDQQSRFTNLATIAGVPNFLKILNYRGTGNEQEDSTRSLLANAGHAGSVPAIDSLQLEPEEYQHARRYLKKAVLELYR